MIKLTSVFRKRLIGILLMLFVVILAACSPNTVTVEVTRTVTETVVEEGETVETTGVISETEVVTVVEGVNEDLSGVTTSQDLFVDLMDNFQKDQDDFEKAITVTAINVINEQGSLNNLDISQTNSQNGLIDKDIIYALNISLENPKEFAEQLQIDESALVSFISQYNAQYCVDCKTVNVSNPPQLVPNIQNLNPGLDACTSYGVNIFPPIELDTNDKLGAIEKFDSRDFENSNKLQDAIEVWKNNNCSALVPKLTVKTEETFIPRMVVEYRDQADILNECREVTSNAQVLRVSEWEEVNINSKSTVVFCGYFTKYYFDNGQGTPMPRNKWVDIVATVNLE